jgi:hypothetical protein
VNTGHLPAQTNYHQSNYFRETTFVNNEAYKTALIAISTVEATKLRIPSSPCKPVMRKCATNPGHRTMEGMRRVTTKICNNVATANPTPIAFLKGAEQTLPTRQQETVLLGKLFVVARHHGNYAVFPAPCCPHLPPATASCPMRNWSFLPNWQQHRCYAKPAALVFHSGA